MVSELLKPYDSVSGAEPLCIRFTNTVGARKSESPNEYLASPLDLEEWLRARHLMGEGGRVTEEFRLRALELRDAIYRLCSAVAAGARLAESDLDVLNSEVCEGLAKLELNGDLGWTLAQSDVLERAMSLVALSAAELLSSPLRTRLRECADEQCGWLFLDHSKNRSRRWCSMSDCGNLAKARRFLAKKRAANGH